MASRETPALRRMRASRRHLPSHTAPLMSFEPNPASPEPRPLPWKLKNLRSGSGRHRQLSWPQVTCLGCVLFLLGKDAALGRAQISSSQRAGLFPCQAFLLARLPAGHATSGLLRTPV